MKRPSFSTQLVVLWGLIAAICAMLVAVMQIMSSAAESQQVAGARQQASVTCEAVASRYILSRPLAGAPANTDLMHAVLDMVLAQAPGVEGGFWTAAASASVGATAPTSDDTVRSAPAAGFLTYAFPTYEGSGIKRDIPQAETPLILRTLRTAAIRHAAATDVIETGQDAVVAAACPVRGEAALFAWMLTRARPPLGPHGQRLVTGLAAVLAAILVVAVALALALRRWKRQLNQLERALASRGDIEHAAALCRVGEPELDRIVDALNQYAERARALRRQTTDLSGKLASAERFGMLGKLAAQVAHEIRNPIGAMRLKAENALAGDSERQHGALRFMLEQIRRIETQVASLLALTQPVTIAPQTMDLGPWLREIVASHHERAHARDIQLVSTLDPQMDDANASERPRFDPEQLRRALDNLLLNALRHVGEGGHVTVVARRTDAHGRAHLRIAVSDDGPGVPAAQRERIFEPFVTGRPDGSGLGLAVVREIASAHGGRAWLDDMPQGACFVIEIPWQPS
jgi:two-component system, NtrC family, sensor histidine kinase HydH